MQKAQLMLVRAVNGKHMIERKVQHLSVASIRLLFGVVTIEKSTHEYQQCCSVVVVVVVDGPRRHRVPGPYRDGADTSTI